MGPAYHAADDKVYYRVDVKNTILLYKATDPYK